MTKEESELKYECEDGYVWTVADWDDTFVWLHCTTTEDDIQISNCEFEAMEVHS